MRRSILVIVVLLVAAGYFVLRVRHDAPTAAGAPIAAPAPLGADAPAQTAPGTANGRAAPANPATPESSEAAADARAKQAAALLAELDDPKSREEIKDRVMQTYSSDSPTGFNHYIGLNDDEYTRLMNLLTDQQIEQFRAQLECGQQPKCDQAHVMQTLVPEQYRARAQMLGPERAQRLENYIDYQAVRFGVGNLRSLLPESQRLGDAQADKLAEALAAERHRVIEEIGQRGTTTSSIGSMQGQLVIPATAESVDQKYDAAVEYQHRMNNRAAEFLNPQQLAVFKQMQADWLAGIRTRWEREAASAGAH